MKAALYYKDEKSLRIEEVPTPEPGPGEVRVKVAACGICHTDLHYLDHGVPTFKAPPMILGHEISGVIDQIGTGVTGMETGDHTIIPAVLTCGNCENCRRGRENICAHMMMVGNNINGGYAEYIVVPAKDLVPLPKHLNLENCSIIADALSTPYHAVVNRGEIKPGQVVSVFGCGGVGINVVQFAVLAGAKVIAVDLSDEKLETAKELGAYAVYNAKEEKLSKIIRKTTGGCDVAFEVIGKPEVMIQAMSTLKAGARFVMVGYSADDVKLPAARIMYREMEIRGSLGCRPVDYHAIVNLVDQGRVALDPLISNRYPIDDINRGFDDLREGKPVIRNLMVTG
ncbi:MAG: alcohol dehydrogenase catalytic domain-containing protein [bacterium]|nr:alcohol dehydrogenase catalytic domain-containing protein [bacterium]